MILDIHSDEYYMKQALLEAKNALKENEMPVGAVIVNQQKIIARGCNQTQKLNDATAHAEMIAISVAQEHLGSKYLDECALYVTLEPCVMCAGALFWCQLKKIYFACSDKKRGYQSINPSILHPKAKICGGLFQKESHQLIEYFFNRLRK